MISRKKQLYKQCDLIFNLHMHCQLSCFYSALEKIKKTATNLNPLFSHAKLDPSFLLLPWRLINEIWNACSQEIHRIKESFFLQNRRHLKKNNARREYLILTTKWKSSYLASSFVSFLIFINKFTRNLSNKTSK